MNKIYYIYIIPPKGAKVSSKDPTEFGWGLIEKHSEYAYKYFCDEYKKSIIDHTGQEWAIIFEDYAQLGGISFIISRESLENDITQRMIDSQYARELFNTYKKECGVDQVSKFSYYELSLYGSRAELEKGRGYYDHLFLEDPKGNTLLDKDGQCIYLYLNLSRHFVEPICNNIIFLLTASAFAYFLIPTLAEVGTKKSTNEKYKHDIFKLFWNYRPSLQECIGSQIFPYFFKIKMSTIDNLLDYQNTDLLEQIHKVEGNILYLTLFIIFDVIFKVSFEMLKILSPFELGEDAFKLISFVLALGLAIIISPRISGDYDEGFSGYYDRMYDLINRDR